MTESELLKAATEYLQLLENQGKLVWLRNNSFAGQILRGNHTVGYIRNAKRGASDLIVFMPGGEYMCLEAKSKTGSQSEDQLLFQKRIERLGGFYALFKNFEELRDIIDSYLAAYKEAKLIR